ncbi:hypothetical protein DENSPDRAFT_608816 [Dentipellis sp. KUC8613]|nr:hypothetical protein DENSPDRAFT_608816 [Dentipellis sp. KUC8613]
MLHQTTMLEQHSMSLQAPGSDDIDHKRLVLMTPRVPLISLTSCSCSHNELQTFGRDLSRKLTSLLELFQEIVTDEYCPGQETVPKVVADFSHTAYADTGYSTFTCDFCGADIFLSFFECQSCVPDPESESGSDTRQTLGDGLLICPGCFVEGRTCLCGEMTPVQIWSYDHLIADYNRAFQALSKVRAVGRTAFSELRTGHISLSEDRVGVFDAACLLYGLRRTGSRIQKDVAPCNFKRPLHTVPSLECFICKKCHRSRCLKCLLTDGIHCSEVFYHHGKDKEHSEWHEYHLSTRRLYTDARRQATSAEGSGDTMSKLSGYRLTLAASTFPRCLPLHEAYIRLGWYDQRPSRHASAPSPMDMSTALDKTMEEHIHGWTDGQSVDGLRDASPISDIAAPSTKPTPAPPPRKGPPGLRHSVVQAKESPPILSDPPPRVKRKSSSFEGVVVSKGEKKRRVGPASRTATSASASASTSAAATAKVPEDNSRTNGTVEHARPAAEDTIDSQKVLESHSKILENIMEQNKQIMNLFSERTRDLKDVVKRQGQSTNAFLERKLEEVKSALSKQTEENKAIRKELSDVKSKLEQLNGDTVESLGRIKELLTEPREEDPEDTPPPPANVPQPQPQPQVQRKQAAVQRAQEPAVETAWVPREGYPPEHAAPHQPRRQETYSKHEQHDYPPEQYDDHAYQRGSWQGGYHQAYTRAPYRGRAHYKPRGNRGYRYYNDYRQQRPNQYYQPHPQPHPYYGHDSYEPDPYYDGEYAAPNPNPRPPPQSYPAHVSAPHTYPPTPASNPPAQASGSKPQSAPPPVQARSQHSHAHAHQHQHAHAHAEQHPRSQHVEHHARAPSRKSSQLTVRADREEPRRHREREDPIPQQSSPSPRTPSSTGYYASYRTGSGSDATYSDQELAGGGKSSRE